MHCGSLECAGGGWYVLGCTGGGWNAPRETKICGEKIINKNITLVAQKIMFCSSTLDSKMQSGHLCKKKIMIKSLYSTGPSSLPSHSHHSSPIHHHLIHIFQHTKPLNHQETNTCKTLKFAQNKKGNCWLDCSRMVRARLGRSVHQGRPGVVCCGVLWHDVVCGGIVWCSGV